MTASPDGKTPPPVFGPERPRAAYRAHSAYEAAYAAYADDPWSDRKFEAMKAAKRNRDQYPEYANSAAVAAFL